MKTLAELTRKKWEQDYGFAESGPEAVIADQVLGCLEAVLQDDRIIGTAAGPRGELVLCRKSSEDCEDIVLCPGALVAAMASDGFSAAAIRANNNKPLPDSFEKQM